MTFLMQMFSIILLDAFVLSVGPALTFRLTGRNINNLINRKVRIGN